jgi:acyl-coenzyme A thioesterase PaaI-like protein
LATQDTIVAWQSFYKPPDSTSKYGQVLCLALLGSGVNGHVDTSHGGFVAVLFDEGFGLVAGNQRPDDRAVMTVSLKIDYKKPVPTPGVVLCRCWLEKEERRKMWIRGAIEDGDGTVLATAQSLFLVVEGLKPLERL